MNKQKTGFVRTLIVETKSARFAEGLQTIFTPWQEQIIAKRLSGELLTKSEVNELSRRIKPKIRAMTDLRDLYVLL